MSKKRRSENYIVGRGKPPQGAKWQKGESGNPKGRPKKKVSTFESEVLAVICKKVTVNVGGKEIEITKRQLLIEQIITRAIKGEPTMARLALPLLKVAESSPAFEVQPEDEAALKSFFKRMGVSHDSKSH